ncbi:MAG: iron chelate uptake ABC transporter family permease subunit, partial [Oscillospiraceae bacterium]|nr:iron chelate uptake ABC transporter family permease subunit [Oscillospiraceae bacterium]
MKFLQTFFPSKKAVFAVSILALLSAIVISLCVGVVMYTPAQLLQLPNILRYIRFPRVMAAVFAGAGLAGAGVIIQTLLGNSLAGPNIIGVNSGAGFMTLIAALVFPLVPQMQPLAAFLGALFSVMMIYLLSRRAGTSKMTILLSGVV